MNKLLIFIILTLTSSVSYCQISHNEWTELLKKHVSNNGQVSYKTFLNDSTKLNHYLSNLEKNPPQKDWSKNRLLAYWINAYNAYTVKLILMNYPIKGIKEIGGKIPFVNSTWDIKFIKIKGENKDLNYIEHHILRRKFDDPRIHMALVCASRSCPVLRNEAFTEQNIEMQLDDQCRNFLKDSSRNNINPKESEISMIFKWYSGDFKKMGGVNAFINKYSLIKINEDTKKNYMSYDWNLND